MQRCGMHFIIAGALSVRVSDGGKALILYLQANSALYYLDPINEQYKCCVRAAKEIVEPTPYLHIHSVYA
jgi:hypothetical protein